MSLTETAKPALAGVEEIRAAFPALRRVHNGRPVAYFDGPGGTQVPRVVLDAMGDYLFHHNANTHWNYPTSQETDAALLDARLALAELLGAAPAEIAFGANMTTLTFHLARALGRNWSEGDEVVVTELDHHANIDPWRALERDRGFRVRSVRMLPEEGRLDEQALEKAVTSRTRLLAIGAASNALGTINDLPRAVELARAQGALVFVDAVHYVPHALVDVRQLGCDFLACSAYKFYGPHVGVLYARRELLEALPVPKLVPAPDAAPERIETGTQNHEGIVGAAAAVDFLASLAPGPTRRARLAATYDALQLRAERLLARLWNGLRAIPAVTLYGRPPGAPRTPTLAFNLAGLSSDRVALALAERGIFCSNGDFYALTVIERLGEQARGVVRAGCAAYTTEDEVERLLDAVRELAAGKG